MVKGDYKIHSDLQYADMRRWRRLMGMKQIIMMMAVVVLVGCEKLYLSKKPDPPKMRSDKVEGLGNNIATSSP